MQRLARLIAPRFHYNWLVLAVMLLILLCATGICAMPSVMVLPPEHEFGWSRSTISLVISIGIALYGLTGPLAAASMQYFGIRPTVLDALMVLVAGTALSAMMHAPRQMALLWGVMVGGGTGVAAITLGVTVVNRWFTPHRGLAMGILTASSATGQLVLLLMTAVVVEYYDWRPVVLIVASMPAVLLPVVWLSLPESPKSVGLHTYGEPADAPGATQGPRTNPITPAMQILVQAVRKRDFWLLFASFFTCGASTNGYIGTYFIAMCADHGFSETKGASLFVAMGIFDLVGTTLLGWLSDRYNSRVLLFWYYGLRGLSLIYLPYVFGFESLGPSVFAAFYGLDWIVTVPPTVRLTSDVFGKAAAPIVFGWIVVDHQLGATFVALGAGMMRASLGNYTFAFITSGGLYVTGTFLALRIYRMLKKDAERADQPAIA